MSDGDDSRDKFKKPLQRPALALPSKRVVAARETLPVPVAPPPAAAAEPPAQGGGLARLLEAISRALTPKPPPKGPAEPVIPA